MAGNIQTQENLSWGRPWGQGIQHEGTQRLAQLQRQQLGPESFIVKLKVSNVLIAKLKVSIAKLTSLIIKLIYLIIKLTYLIIKLKSLIVKLKSLFFKLNALIVKLNVFI